MYSLFMSSVSSTIQWFIDPIPISIPLIDSNDILNSSYPASTFAFGFGSPAEFLMQLGLYLYLFTCTIKKCVGHYVGH